MTPKLESDFSAWVQRRDVDALTRVFDATAGRLLLPATHVAGRNVAPEDLVQTTFLAAMESAETFDRTRPIWPWLAAILQNGARMEFRKAERRREIGIDGVVPIPTEGPDPATLVASDDAFDAIVETIDALPLEYRQVLRLRLVHGLSHGEIAHSLELPVGTVRARTHRGLARLRDALPSTISATVLGAFLAGEGSLLAQVRSQVIETAKGAGTAVASGALATAAVDIGLKSKSSLLMAVGIALLALCALAWAVLDGRYAASGSHTSGVEIAAETGPQSPLERGIEDAPARLPLTEASDSLWPLTGLVRTFAGEPIAGARVEISLVPLGVAYPEDSLGEELTVVQSDADGRFACDLDSLRNRSSLFRTTSLIWIRAFHPHYVGERKLITIPASTAARAFTVELSMHHVSQYLIGTVVDAAGQPVAGADLTVVTSEGRSFASKQGCSDEVGKFRLNLSNQALPVNARVIASHPQHGIGGATLSVAANPVHYGEAARAGIIQLESGSTLQGRVVLGDGIGVGDYPLEMHRLPPGLGDDLAQVQHFVTEQQKQWNWRESYRFGDERQLFARFRTQTAADGTFVLTGLDKNARYAVVLRDGCTNLILAVGQPDANPIELVVDCQLLLVDVLDTSNEALVGARIHGQGLDPDCEDRGHGWPGFPKWGVRVGNPMTVLDSAGRRMLLSPFGWTWRILPGEKMARTVIVRHDVIVGVHRTTLTMNLAPQESFGAAQLEVVDLEGKPFGPFDVSLQSLDGGMQRTILAGHFAADGLIPELAPGRWKVTVNVGKVMLVERGLGPCRFRARGLHELEFLVVPDKITAVRIEAAPAGSVYFRLVSDSLPENRDWKPLVIRHENSARQLNSFLLKPDPDPKSGGRIGSRELCGRGLALGSEVFAPGRHAFTLEVDGFRPARCEVMVELDRLVEVRVQLLPL